MLGIIIVLSFISVILILQPILRLVINSNSPILRLRRYFFIEEIKDEKKKNNIKSSKKSLDIISQRVGKFKLINGYKKGIQEKLICAHVLLKAEEFITISLIVSGALAVLVFMISQNLFYSIVFLIIGWLIPTFYLNSKIKSRLKVLNDQLNDAISLIANSLKAGYSFFQAVDVVAKEMKGPISEEFVILQKEINLGVTTERALDNLVERVKSDDLELVVTAVLIQRQVGGNLAEVLDNISSTIRERIKIKGEIRTVTAQGRMSGWVISLLPPILGLVLFLINPGHIGILFKSGLGIGVLVLSLLMELTGIFFISKIVKIEV